MVLIFKVIAWTVIALCIIGVMAFFFIFHQNPAATAITYSHTNTVNAVLRAQNQPFERAELIAGLTDSSSTAMRIALYQQALELAADKTQEGHIKYKLGIATLKNHDYLGAVGIFKDIGSDTEYSMFDRAYAVQTIGNIFYNYHDPKIADETFSQELYASLRVQNDIQLSYRHMYEYAASIYPLAMSEARIADWYANDLLLLEAASSSLSNEVINAHVLIIKNAFVKLDADIARTKDDPNAAVDAPDALLREAIVLGKLAELKLGDPSDAEKVFEQSRVLQMLIAKHPNPYYFFHYSKYLADIYGVAKSSEIKTQLSELYNGGYTKQDPIINFLTNERNNITNTKSDLKRLAQIDPKFKSFLLTLGWTDADFKT